jgi:hypothetical protein
MILQTTTAAIAAGATGLSAAIDTNASRLAAIYIPAGWVAADITVLASIDGTTYTNVYDSAGDEYTITVTGASTVVLVPLVDFLGLRFIKLRSGTASVPVNQTGAPTLTLALVP